MGDQEDIVKWSNPASGGEFHGPFSDGTEHPEVISEITGQEDCRTNKGRDHASDVCPLLVSTNGDPANCDKAGTESVQSRVHQRKIKDIHRTSGLKRIETEDKIGWSPKPIKVPKRPPFARDNQHGNGNESIEGRTQESGAPTDRAPLAGVGTQESGVAE
jgi:hypothetical protein